MLSEWAGPLGFSSEGKRKFVWVVDDRGELGRWWSWRTTMRRWPMHFD
jgi:hypothetical protein